MNPELTIGQFLTQIPYFSLLSSSQSFIRTITIAVDVIAVTIAAISIFQVIFSSFHSNMQSLFDVRAAFRITRHSSVDATSTSAPYLKLKKNLVSGLLFALELESANAILKLGLFTSLITGAQVATTAIHFGLGDINNNFIFFVGELSLRITINQTLRRFS
jgi:hypothetical protein